MVDLKGGWMFSSGEAFLNISGMNRLEMIHQDQSTECGLASIAMIANFFGYKTDLPELRRKYPTSQRGISLKDLKDIAVDLGLSARGVKCELSGLKALRAPCVLHWDFDHFVVLAKVTRSKLVIYDPAKGKLSLSYEEVVERFTGIALEVAPSKGFKQKSSPVKLNLGSLVRFDRQFLSYSSLGLVLSLIAECLVLASPFYLQIMIDEVLVKSDIALLNSLALGFFLIVIFQILANVLRRLSFQFIGNLVSLDMASKVYTKLVSLPIRYFSSRRLGDIQHRIQSLAQIQHFLSFGGPQLLMDCVFGVLILSILFFYSLNLTLFVLTVICLYALYRLFTYGIIRRVAGDLIAAEAKSETHLLETIKSIATIKMTATEAEREEKWQNSLAGKLNATIRVGNLDILNMSVSELLFQGARVLLVFVCAKMVIFGSMSIGMMTAYVAYYGMVSNRFSSLIELTVQLKLLSVPIGRVSDIVLSKDESDGEDGGRIDRLKGKLEVINAAFRYDETGDYVLRRVSFSVAPGELVAIVGASGAGKTTLLKILAGLEDLSSGEILYDDRDLRSWSKKTLRRQIGVVLQNDTLLSGTISENVTTFDPKPDIERVRAVCKVCNVLSEIDKMPMGFETVIGDMGHTLSGGQQQRILLARAIYQQPAMLLLDEATSHLDSKNEFEIQRAISSMGVTRIIIAHRRETIESADRIIELNNGKIIRSDRSLVEEAIKNFNIENR